MTTTPLRSLLSEQGALCRVYHHDEPVVLRGAAVLDGLPVIEDVDRLVDAGLLRWPYFTVVRDGIEAPRDEVTRCRTARGAEVDGFLSPDGVRGHVAAGATIRLNQVEDWHPAVRAQADELRAAFPAEITSFLFRTAAGGQAVPPGGDGARTVVVQIEGTTEWRSEVDRIVLDRGDVLYLPRDHGSTATAGGSTSLHLAFTVAEPAPTALLEALIRCWAATPEMADLVEQQFGMTVTERAAAVLVELEKFARQADADAVLAEALTPRDRS